MEPDSCLTCVGNDAQGPGYYQADQQRIRQGLSICGSLQRIAVRLSQVTLEMEASLCNDPCTGTAESAPCSDHLIVKYLLMLPPAMRPSCAFDHSQGCFTRYLLTWICRSNACGCRRSLYDEFPMGRKGPH